MASKVKVALADRSYDIQIGPGLISKLGETCCTGMKAGRCLLVTDRNVNRLYGAVCEKVLRKSGFDVLTVVVPARESSKSKKWLFAIYDAALKHGMGRNDLMVALGGGVVGDLTGYAAASFMRGINFVQVPTSLLAMVDSSVGGKTGINLPQGKNLVGAFHQPLAVIADLDVLKSLPEREYRSGLAEVVKYGIIEDPRFFESLEQNLGALAQRDSEYLAYVVSRCCEIKAEVVRFDENEKGLRAILNFGHTFGHALENCCGYGHLFHGEAIAIGTVYAAHLSQELLRLKESDLERIVSLLRNLSLPVTSPSLAWRDLMRAMKKDKKSVDAMPLFVLASRIGTVEFGCEVSEKLLKATWSKVLKG